MAVDLNIAVVELHGAAFAVGRVLGQAIEGDDAHQERCELRIGDHLGMKFLLSYRSDHGQIDRNHLWRQVRRGPLRRWRDLPKAPITPPAFTIFVELKSEESVVRVRPRP